MAPQNRLRAKHCTRPHWSKGAFRNTPRTLGCGESAQELHPHGALRKKWYVIRRTRHVSRRAYGAVRETSLLAITAYGAVRPRSLFIGTT